MNAYIQNFTQIFMWIFEGPGKKSSKLMHLQQMQDNIFNQTTFSKLQTLNCVKYRNFT